MLVSFDVSTQLRGRQIEVEGPVSDGQMPIRFIIGKRTCMVQAKRQGKISYKSSHVRISKELAGAFGIPSHCSLHVRAQQNVWRIGPVLGLYADSVNSESRPYGEQTRMFEELTTYGEDLGVYVVVLSPRQPFRARFDTESRVWNKCDAEPDIVIRRSGGFTDGSAKRAREDLSKYQRIGKLHTLPRSMSNKWNLYQVLQTRPSLKTHLPQTTLCTSGQQLWNAACTRKDVYLKPTGGAQGISIYHLFRKGQITFAEWEKRVVPRRTERLTNTFETRTEKQRLVLKTPEDFRKFWKSTRLTRAIVQDTVLLPIQDGLRCDFRWLLHSSENPAVIARVARLGQKDAITTNIHTGGTAKSADETLKQIVGEGRADALLSEMDDVALQVVRTLSKQFGPFAELGIDMAVTHNGDIFIFEVNPTPGRRMLRQLPPGVRRLSLDSLLEYAVKATNYGN